MAAKSFAPALGLLALLSAAAMAQEPPAGGLGQLCKAELASLCAEGGKGVRCLLENQAKLGAECAAAVKVVQERREKLRAACQADAEKLCQGPENKGGQMVQCLKSKLAELSKGCADALAAIPAPAAKQ